MVKPANSAASITPARMDAAYRNLFGRSVTQLNPYVDDSMIGRTENEDYMGWEEVDEKYRNRPIREVGRRTTAALANERYGLPLMFLATEVAFTLDQVWEVITNEIRQVQWVAVGPTGIPRTSSWKKTVERGGTTRYKHFFSMPNEALVDPNFGRDNLMHGLEMVIENLLYTLMITVSCNISYRGMLNELSDNSHACCPADLLTASPAKMTRTSHRPTTGYAILSVTVSHV